MNIFHVHWWMHNFLWALSVPLCLIGREVCLAVVWAVKMDLRFLYPCGLLLYLRGNYTELIKKNVADEIYKSNNFTCDYFLALTPARPWRSLKTCHTWDASRLIKNSSFYYFIKWVVHNLDWKLTHIMFNTITLLGIIKHWSYDIACQESHNHTTYTWIWDGKGNTKTEVGAWLAVSNALLGPDLHPLPPCSYQTYHPCVGEKTCQACWSRDSVADA